MQQLRSNPTEAEARLWAYLRCQQLDGFRFRRQHAIDHYVVDFYCPKARLIIELDGPIHRSQVAEDRDRQDALEEMGFQVLRFSNDRVMEQIDRVIEEIRERLS